MRDLFLTSTLGVHLIHAASDSLTNEQTLSEPHDPGAEAKATAGSWLPLAALKPTPDLCGFASWHSQFHGEEAIVITRAGISDHGWIFQLPRVEARARYRSVPTPKVRGAVWARGLGVDPICIHRLFFTLGNGMDGQYEVDHTLQSVAWEICGRAWSATYSRP